jgi:hypothetical protein
MKPSPWHRRLPRSSPLPLSPLGDLSTAAASPRWGRRPPLPPPLFSTWVIPSYVFLPSPSRPLLVLVLIGFAFSHYWWLIGCCLCYYLCLSFPFSRRWHNVSDTTITFAFMFLFLLKILYPYPRIGVFLGNSVSAYLIRIVSDTRTRICAG